MLKWTNFYSHVSVPEGTCDGTPWNPQRENVVGITLDKIWGGWHLCQTQTIIGSWRPHHCEETERPTIFGCKT